jgi:hypothetical protein
MCKTDDVTTMQKRRVLHSTGPASCLLCCPCVQRVATHVPGPAADQERNKTWLLPAISPPVAAEDPPVTSPSRECVAAVLSTNLIS